MSSLPLVTEDALETLDTQNNMVKPVTFFVEHWAVKIIHPCRQRALGERYTQYALLADTVIAATYLIAQEIPKSESEPFYLQPDSKGNDWNP